jgi:hypothetical protein
MNSLKKRCPEVVKLQNLLYDAMNIISRYSNKMNRHLWKKEEIFLEFKKELDHIMGEVGDVYFNYFSSLIDLAKLGWSDEKANTIYEKYIPNFFPKIYEKTRKLIDNLTKDFENAGLSTDKLYLKTGWRQTVQINTFGGKIGK